MKLKEISFRYKIASINIIGILSFLLILLYIIPRTYNVIYEMKLENMKNIVDIAIGYLKSLDDDYNTGKISRQDVKTRAIKRIRSMRFVFDLKDYLWINDLTPLMIMHPYLTELEGKDVSDFRDPDNKALFKEFVSICKKNGEGYVAYKWQLHEKQEIVTDKISYVKLYKPLGWIIGSGVYINKIRQETRRMLALTVSVLILIMSATIFLTYLISKFVKSREEVLFKTEKNLEKSYSQIRQIVNSISSIIIGVSTDDTIIYWNKSAEKTFKRSSPEVIDTKLYELDIKWDTLELYEGISNCIIDDSSVRLEDVTLINHEGNKRLLGIVISPIRDIDNSLAGFIIQAADVTERRFLEVQLTQARKMESIGQMTAGIAHEINSPLQFINDNTKFVNKSMQNISQLLNNFSILLDKNKSGRVSKSLLKRITSQIKDMDEEYLLEEIPKAIDQSLEGITRILNIVKSMKEFAHPDKGDLISSDINKAIESTITISRNEWKYIADMNTDFDPELKNVPCSLSEFNQAVLNVIINAAQTIEEKSKSMPGFKGKINIKTKKNSPWAEISISDNGNGIPENIQAKIFDPFFTTKDVGKGTGQGLPIAHTVIVKKHKGEFFFETNKNEGTTFFIRIPLESKKEEK